MKFKIKMSGNISKKMLKKALLKYLPDYNEYYLDLFIDKFNYIDSLEINDNNIYIIPYDKKNILSIYDDTFVIIVFNILGLFNEETKIIKINDKKEYLIFLDYINNNCINYNNSISEHIYCENIMFILNEENYVYEIDNVIYQIFFKYCKTINSDIFIRTEKFKKLYNYK